MNDNAPPRRLGQAPGRAVVRPSSPLPDPPLLTSALLPSRLLPTSLLHLTLRFPNTKRLKSLVRRVGAGGGIKGGGCTVQGPGPLRSHLMAHGPLPFLSS